MVRLEDDDYEFDPSFDEYGDDEFGTDPNLGMVCLGWGCVCMCMGVYV